MSTQGAISDMEQISPWTTVQTTLYLLPPMADIWGILEQGTGGVACF